jgi:hypothetical protein
MAKATLPTNYRDDILNASTEGKRKYRMNYNDDGTVSFVDVTPYDQEGSDFGAGDINRTNEAVNQSFDKNKLIRDMEAINALTQEGYAPDALALKDVNDSLIPYPDYENKVKVLTETGIYTPESDGWISVYIGGSSNVSVKFGTMTILHFITQASTGYTVPPFPAKKGDVITFTLTSGSGNLSYIPNR